MQRDWVVLWKQHHKIQVVIQALLLVPLALWLEPVLFRAVGNGWLRDAGGGLGTLCVQQSSHGKTPNIMLGWCLSADVCSASRVCLLPLLAMFLGLLAVRRCQTCKQKWQACWEKLLLMKPELLCRSSEDLKIVSFTHTHTCMCIYIYVYFKFCTQSLFFKWLKWVSVSYTNTTINLTFGAVSLTLELSESL